MGTKTKETSQNYAIRCAETLVADRTITEETIFIMFMEYKKILLRESNQINNQWKK